MEETVSIGSAKCPEPYPVISLQGVYVVRAAAGVARSIFISSDGVGYWCGQGSGELHNVRMSNKATQFLLKLFFNGSTLLFCLL